MVRGFTPSLGAYPRRGYASDFGKDDAMTGRIRAVTNFRALCCGLESMTEMASLRGSIETCLPYLSHSDSSAISFRALVSSSLARVPQAEAYRTRNSRVCRTREVID
jgi:hypothetical protein